MGAAEATESFNPLSALDTASLAGSAHLRSIIRVVRDMVELRGRQQQQQQPRQEAASVPNQANHAPDTAAAAASNMAALAAQYGEAKAGLQIAFKQMAESSSGSSQAPGGEGMTCSDDLQQRYDGLVKEVEQRNETINELMDVLRQLLDAMCMWEAHKKHLDQTDKAAQR